MMKKRVVALFVVAILLFSSTAQALDISAVGACSVDFETETIIYEKNIDNPMTPASLTKIMTLYIIFEKLADGTLTKDTLIPISEYAARFSRESGVSNIPLRSGDSVPLETLIDAIVIVSACASCTVVAEYISGTEYQFTLLMNQKASELGMEAYFTDSSGLSNDNVASPRAMALLACRLIKKYPDVLNYTKKTSAVILGRTYTSTNSLLSQNSSYYYSGADGLKTGTTSRAGNCLVSTAYRNGKRVIGVVMKASDRYKDSIALLNDAFSRISQNQAGTNSSSINSSFGSKDKETYLYSTDIKAYIDDFEIPCCYSYQSKNPTLCVITTNLGSFGFDVTFDNEKSTVYIQKNSEKPIYTMVPGDDEPMTPMYKILGTNNKKVVLVTPDGEYPLNTVFSLNGQSAISIDELAKHFSSSWSDTERKLRVYTD